MTIFKSIAVVTALFASGLVIAANTQDDAICSERDHTGYRYTGPNAQPALPLNTSEVGLSGPKTFGTDFECSTNPQEVCHYVYMAPDAANPNGRWIKCSGNYEEL